MATKKQIPATDKLEGQDFPLFPALSALDKKDYGFFDTLTEEQQSKFVPFMVTQWLSSVNRSSDIQSYYVLSTEYHANKYMFNENVMKHPKLLWQLLCASAPATGFSKHVWIPQLGIGVSSLRKKAVLSDVKAYFEKIYAGADQSDIDMLSEAYVKDQHKKFYIASNYPDLKFDDIELLSQLITDEDIKQYERDKGN